MSKDFWDDDAKPVSTNSFWEDDSAPVAHPNNTPVESAVRGFAQDASLGFADEATGGAEALKDVVTNKDKHLKDYLDLYRQHRDESRSNYEQAEKDNPWSYKGGQLAGSLATAAVPGLGIAKGAKLLSAAGKMALLGGATAAGSSEADLTKAANSYEDLKKEGGRFANDVTKGAIIGGLTEGAVGGVTKNAPELLRYLAERRAAKAAIGQNKSVIKEAIKSDTLNKMGRDLLTADEAGGKAVGFIDRSGSIAPKVEAKKDFFGKKIGEVSDKIDEVMPNAVSGQEIANSIIEKASKIPDLPQTRGIINRMQETAAQFEQSGNMSFKDAQRLKNQFKVSAQDHTQEITSKTASNDMYHSVKEAMDNTAKTVGDVTDNQGLKELLGSYGEYKGKYKTYKTLDKAAKDREAANLANRFVSPSDYGVGSTAAVVGSLAGGSMGPAALLGIGAAGANKVARTYGSAASASVMDGIADIIQHSPETLGRFLPGMEKALRQGGPELFVMHQMLMEKNPEYRQRFQGGK